MRAKPPPPAGRWDEHVYCPLVLLLVVVPPSRVSDRAARLRQHDYSMPR